MARSVLSQAKAFCTSNRNHTAKALALAVASMDHMLAHKDWDAAAWLLGNTDPRMSNQLKAVFRACLGNITVKADAKHYTGYRFKFGEQYAGTDVLSKLRDLVADGATLYSDEVNTLIGKEKQAAAEKTPAELEEHVRKYLAKRGYVFVGKIEAAPEVEAE